MEKRKSKRPKWLHDSASESQIHSALLPIPWEACLRLVDSRFGATGKEEFLVRWAGLQPDGSRWPDSWHAKEFLKEKDQELLIEEYRHWTRIKDSYSPVPDVGELFISMRTLCSNSLCRYSRGSAPFKRHFPSSYTLRNCA